MLQKRGYLYVFHSIKKNIKSFKIQNRVTVVCNLSFSVLPVYEPVANETICALLLLFAYYVIKSFRRGCFGLIVLVSSNLVFVRYVSEHNSRFLVLSF